MAKLEEQIEATKKRLEQLKARQQKIEAQKRAEQKKKSRKDDLRRKILIGAMFMERMENDMATKAKITADLDAYLIRADDRTLFNLEVEPSMLDLIKEVRPSLFEKKTEESQTA